MTKVIGLAGGIGSGKSTVCRLLADMGAVVIDADKVGHEVFLPDTDAWRDVVATFGKQVVAPNGEIDRKKLGEIVFKDHDALLKLNAIMHPRMFDLMKARIEEHRRQGVDVVVLEAALLLEAGWKPLVDELWYTVASEKMVAERLKQQRGLKEGETKARMESQARIRSEAATTDYLKQADVVINNDGDMEHLKAKIKELWQRIHSGKATK